MPAARLDGCRLVIMQHVESVFDALFRQQMLRGFVV